MAAKPLPNNNATKSSRTQTQHTLRLGQSTKLCHQNPNKYPVNKIQASNPGVEQVSSQYKIETQAYIKHHPET